MTDKTENDLPEVITTQRHVVDAARKGMSLRSIAARAGKSVIELKALLDSNPTFSLAYENAVADYEEEKRKSIDEAESLARQNNDASLLYKINREAIKELNERDNANRPLRVVLAQEDGLFEPEYEELPADVQAEIRERTEREANRDE